jgi:hypothetical protein
MPVPYRGRLAVIRNRVVVAIIFYGIALLLLLLAFVVGDRDAGQYLFDGALITAASATGLVLSSIRKRRPD